MRIWIWITGGLLALVGILAGLLKIRERINTQCKINAEHDRLHD